LNKIFKAEPGLTLVELLIAFGMLGFVLAAIYSFYLSGLSGWHRSVEKMECQQTARIAMDKMIRELRFAHVIKFNAEGRCHSESAHEFNFNEPYEVICFRTKKDPEDSNLTLFRFRRSGEGEKGQLFFEQRTDNNNHYATNVVALQVTGLSFIVDEAGIIQITINVGSRDDEVILTGSVRPRNLKLEKD